MFETMELMHAPSSAVVQNDISSAKGKRTTNTQSKQVAAAANKAAGTLGEMEAKRMNWEATAYRTSNQQLYAVLADCLAYGTSATTVAAAKARNAEVNAFLEERGYQVRSGSDLFIRVAKAVFGNIQRSRISTYSIVLRTAHKEGVSPTELPAWIEERGGVQEVKLARSASYKSPKQKADEVKSSLSALPTLAVAKDKLAEKADAVFMGTECVLLAEQQADGSFHIKALTRSGTAVNAAMAALYGEQKKDAA
jgi:hypothetical protein